MEPARLLGCVLLIAFPALAPAQSTRMVSRALDGAAADGMSTLPAISADGRFVVFESEAEDLLATDHNGHVDVFRRDLWTGEVLPVSVGESGSTGNGDSHQAHISADGRYVAFQSFAKDLVPHDSNHENDIFVRDMLLGTTVRVSVSSSGAQANGGNRYPYISHDGRMVVFESLASNLVANDTNGMKDVFVHDCLSGETRIASRAWDGSGADFHVLCTSISPDGRYVGFCSEATNLVPGDTNGEMDAFVHDLLTGLTLRVSTDADGNEVHGLSGNLNLSAGALYAVFYSIAPDLLPGDTNHQGDVFVKDLRSGAVQRASLSSTGAQANWDCYYPRVTADGRFVSFFSIADSLVPDDTNGYQDIFLRDMALGTTERVSLTTFGQESSGTSRYSAISDDGRFVAFECAAPNLELPDENSCLDIFVRDRAGWFHSFCAGDGSAPAHCPCSNGGARGHGCPNSAFDTGALLAAQGAPPADNVQLLASGLSGTLAVFLQGDLELPEPAAFGRGLRCIGGNLLRLYSVPVGASAASAPPAGAPGLRARSLELGDAIGRGTTRAYQVWYRDPPADSCADAPTNLSNALRVLW